MRTKASEQMARMLNKTKFKKENEKLERGGAGKKVICLRKSETDYNV